MSRPKLAAALTAVVGVVATPAALGAGQFIEDIQVSRRGDEATVLIDLACPMRFRSDVVTPAGVLIEIRIAPLDACRQLGVGDGITSEAYRPASGHLAHLVEVEYESLGLGDNLLLFHFDRPVDYRVAQRGDLRTLELRVRLTGDAAAPTPGAAAAPVEPVSAAPVAPPASREAPAAVPAGRAPLTARVRTPATLADYVLNLQSAREPVDPGVVAGVPVAAGQHLYVSTTEVSGVTWYRLRLGFFTDEAAAQAALASLAESFPRAWIGRAEASEVQAAADLAVERGGVVAESVADAPAETIAVPGAAGGALSKERIAELSAAARAALVAGDLDTAIRTYTRLLEQPGEHAAEARENLGVAREKNGQTAHAAAEYRRFLADYPEHEGAARVRQRLNGLVTASAAPRERLRTEQTASSWEFTTGLSQYYRRDVNRFDEDQAEVTTLSALFTDLDFSVGQRGTAVDWRGRLTVSHLHDLIGEEGGGPGDREYISYAYADVGGVQDEWSVRVGRQTLHNWGILGRFDGAHGTYGWSSDRRVHVMAGYPVESTRDTIETSRQFVGAAVDFDQLIGEWTVSPFVMQQTIGGIADRKAVGVDMRYFDERRSFTSMLDYDLDYGQLNTALVFGTWRLDSRVTLTAMYDQRSSPVLTTRNALIGQPVTTIDELLLVWTEDEIRQIARERTADGRTMTFGVAAPLAERWQVNADVTATEIGPSIASVGVAAMPGTGVQTYYSTTFVGSALFGVSDVSIFNVRVGRADDFTSSQLTWDLRFPVGRKLRLNPRLRFAQWESPVTNRRREGIAPSLRLLLNTSRHYRFELEVGNDTLTRTDNGGEQKATGNFVYVGYRADF
jgi:tetratricopeptide (TPR) repeat protein